MDQQTTGLPERIVQDRNGEACSIQESSLADEDCIWLGWSTRPSIQVWPSMRGEMHLTQEMVADLIRCCSILLIRRTCLAEDQCQG